LAEYRNPQNEPGADKRMLMALMLVFLVLGVMQFFIPKPPAPPPEQNKQSQQQQPQQPSPVPGAIPSPSTTPVPPKSPAVAMKVPVRVAPAESESVLETPYYRITFSNRGAVVKSWLLT